MSAVPRRDQASLRELVEELRSSYRDIKILREERQKVLDENYNFYR